MAGRLSFSIAINLLTENFKRGSNQVKSAFKSMQMQFLTFAAALGAGGLGLSNFVSRLIEVARETNRVTTALKNVSGSMSQYADNQRYLLDLAKKYGLEINALTANYAKFTAAASISGMSMMNQRKVFESVSRACTAFGMSADDSNGVMLALSQMMSKGKISSEELRLQMGERLPVALQAMAKAAGVSVGGLDKLMKQGKLMSADVLPKFAEALNEMIPNVDTDNLETSVNRLKNAFTEFVNGTDVQSKYKALIDWLTGIVKSAASNIKSIVTYTVATILVLVTSRLVNKIISSIAKAELAAKSAARRAAKDAGIAFNEVAWKAQKTSASIKMAFSKALGSLKSLFISSIPTAVIAIIGTIIAKIVSMSQEANRIKRIFSDIRAESKNAGSSAEVVRMQKLYELATSLKNNLDVRKGALNEINKLLGTSYSIDEKNLGIQGDLNKKYAERVSLLKAAAEVDYFTQKKLELEDKIRTVGQKSVSDFKDSLPDASKSINPFSGNFSPSALWDGPVGMKTLFNMTPWGSFSGAKDGSAELRELQKSLAYVDKRLEISLGTVAGTKNGKTPPTTDPDESKKKTPLQKEQESFNKQFEELKAELEIGKITQAEYNKALGELNIKMYAQAKGTGDKEVLESEYLKARKKAAEDAIKNQDKNAALVEFEKIQKDYNAKVKEAQAQQAKGLMSQKDLNSNIASLSIEAAKSAAGIKGIGDEADVFIAAMQLNAKLLSKRIKEQKYDATFDYKKTKPEILSDKLNIAKKWRDDAKEEAKVLGAEMTEELNKAMTKVTSLEEALKLAQVKEDIKNLNKELNESLYSGVKDIASSSDRIVHAFSNLRDVMNDVDASGWERIMAIWNAMTNVVDTFLSIIKMIESLTELTTKLTKAKEQEAIKTDEATTSKLTEAAVDTTVTGVKVANSEIKKTADTSEADTAVTTATREVAANTAKGVSAAGSSAASLPFPANIIAIGAAIAAAVALFASIPKFATGGVITGGPTSGDKILARVNAGEMILNQGQQSRLFEAINSGKLGGSGNMSSTVTTRVRAKDLILTINNELKSQGKKPIS